MPLPTTQTPGAARAPAAGKRGSAARRRRAWRSGWSMDSMSTSRGLALRERIYNHTRIGQEYEIIKLER